MQSNRETRYNDNGNIIFKTGVGDYQYGSQCIGNTAGPHAVCSTTGAHAATYTYDDNGSLTSDTTGRTLQYTVFDKPSQIQKDGHTTTFDYGPDRNRITRVDTNTQGVVTTRYLGAVEKVTHTTAGGSFTKAYWRRSINGVAIIRLDLDATGNVTQERSPEYVHKDVLGSTDVISDDNGAIAKGGSGNDLIFSFDVWGGRRNGLSWEVLVGQLSTQGYSVFAELSTNRGYTGHEMLDSVGLIHMNGRVYDPLLARFVSADPIIDGVTSTQGYNRYAYVHNNPMAFIDPSGFSRWNYYRDSVVKPVVAIVVAYFLGPQAVGFFKSTLGGTITAGMAGGAVTGFVSGAIATGTIQGAVSGAFSGAAFGAIGGYFDVNGGINSPEHIASHALAGGVIAELQGGDFGHGFLTAGIMKSFMAQTEVGGSIDAIGNNGIEAIVLGLVGGALSQATGGKFSNGFMTTAFQYLLNQKGGGNNDGAQKSGWSWPSLPRASEDSFAGFLWNRTLDGGVREDLFRFVDSLDEPDRYSLTGSIVLGKNNTAYSRGYRVDFSINGAGDAKFYAGSGSIKGRSLSLTVDYNFPIGEGGPSDFNITSKFSRTAPARGIFGTKVSGTLGSGGANFKGGVGLVFGSSGTMPAIGFDQKF